MSGLFSRNKGKDGERAWVKLLERYAPGCRFRRTPCSGGLGDGLLAGDILCVPGSKKSVLQEFSYEIKRVEKLDLRSACQQAIFAAQGKKWLVAHRKSDADWLVTMPAEQFLNLMAELDERRNGQNGRGEDAQKAGAVGTP